VARPSEEEKENVGNRPSPGRKRGGDTCRRREREIPCGVTTRVFRERKKEKKQTPERGNLKRGKKTGKQKNYCASKLKITIRSTGSNMKED